MKPVAISVGRLKAPASVFTRCIECESPNVTKELGHVYCRYCGWNSVKTYEELAVELFGFDTGMLNLELQVALAQTQAQGGACEARA